MDATHTAKHQLGMHYYCTNFTVAVIAQRWREKTGR